MADINDVSTRLAACFMAVFPELTPDTVRRASMVSIAAWDSLATLTLVATIEEAFGITIDFAQLADLVSFDTVADVVASSLD